MFCQSDKADIPYTANHLKFNRHRNLQCQGWTCNNNKQATGAKDVQKYHAFCSCFCCNKQKRKRSVIENPESPQRCNSHKSVGLHSNHEISPSGRDKKFDFSKPKFAKRSHTPLVNSYQQTRPAERIFNLPSSSDGDG